MAFLLCVIAANAFAVPVQGDHTTEYNEWTSVGLEKVIIINTSGKITVTPQPLTKTSAFIQKRNFPEGCEASATRPDRTYVLVQVKGGNGLDCTADITVLAPPKGNLEITSGSGQVSVKGIEGELAFNMGSGKLDAQGKFARLTGKSGSGDVKIEGMNGGGKLEVGSGHVNLTFVDDVQGQFSVNTGSGDAILKFPKGSKIHSSLATGSGSVSNEFDDHPKAIFDLSAKAGSGDLRVKSY